MQSFHAAPESRTGRFGNLKPQTTKRRCGSFGWFLLKWIYSNFPTKCEHFAASDVICAVSDGRPAARRGFPPPVLRRTTPRWATRFPLVSVMVSDTSPRQRLILGDAENILPKLFRPAVIPPTVFQKMPQRRGVFRLILLAALLVPGKCVK
jgi:hypothetical protein